MAARGLDVRGAGRRDAALDDPAALGRLQADATVLLNCAGTFGRPSRAKAEGRGSP